MMEMQARGILTLNLWHSHAWLRQYRPSDGLKYGTGPLVLNPIYRPAFSDIFIVYALHILAAKTSLQNA